MASGVHDTAAKDHHWSTRCNVLSSGDMPVMQVHNIIFIILKQPSCLFDWNAILNYPSQRRTSVDFPVPPTTCVVSLSVPVSVQQKCLVVAVSTGGSSAALVTVACTSHLSNQKILAQASAFQSLLTLPHTVPGTRC